MKFKLFILMILMLRFVAFSTEETKYENCLKSTASVKINDKHAGTGILIKKGSEIFILCPKHLLFNLPLNNLQTLTIGVPQYNKFISKLNENETIIFPVPDMDFVLIYSPELKEYSSQSCTLKQFNKSHTPQLILKPKLKTDYKSISQYTPLELREIQRSNLMDIPGYSQIYELSMANIKKLDIFSMNSINSIVDTSNNFEVELRDELIKLLADINDVETKLASTDDSNIITKLNEKKNELKKQWGEKSKYFVEKKSKLKDFFIDLVGTQDIDITKHKTSTAKGDSGSPYISTENSNDGYMYAMHQGHSELKSESISWGILLKNRTLNEFINTINTDSNSISESDAKGYKYNDFCKHYRNNALMTVLKKAKILDSIVAFTNNLIIKSQKDSDIIANIFSNISINGINYTMDSILNSYLVAQLSYSIFSDFQNDTYSNVELNNQNSNITLSLKDILDFENNNNSYLITTSWNTLKKNYGITYSEENITFKLYEIYSDPSEIQNSKKSIGRHFLYLPDNFDLEAQKDNSFKIIDNSRFSNFTMSIIYSNFKKYGELSALNEYFRLLTGGPTNLYPQDWVDSNSHIITSNYFNLPKKGLNAYYLFKNHMLSKVYIENNSTLNDSTSVAGSGQSFLTALSIKTNSNGSITMTKSLATAYLALILNSSIPFYTD